MSTTIGPPSTESTRVETINTWGRIVISCVGVLTFLGIAVLVLVSKSQMSEAGIMVLGSAASGYALVMGYWIGSSAGSTAKDAKSGAAGATVTTTGPGTTSIATSSGPVEAPFAPKAPPPEAPKAP